MLRQSLCPQVSLPRLVCDPMQCAAHFMTRPPWCLPAETAASQLQCSLQPAACSCIWLPGHLRQPTPHVWLQGPPPPSSGAVSNYMKEGVNRLFRSSVVSPPLSPRHGGSLMSPSSIFQRTSAAFGRPPRKVTWLGQLMMWQLELNRPSRHGRLAMEFCSLGHVVPWHATLAGHRQERCRTPACKVTSVLRSARFPRRVAGALRL